MIFWHWVTIPCVQGLPDRPAERKNGHFGVTAHRNSVLGTGIRFLARLPHKPRVMALADSDTVGITRYGKA